MLREGVRELACLGTQAIWLSSARVSSLWGTLTKMSESRRPCKIGDVLQVHFVSIKVRIVWRSAIRKLLGAEHLLIIYLHR